MEKITLNSYYDLKVGIENNSSFDELGNGFYKLNDYYKSMHKGLKLTNVNQSWKESKALSADQVKKLNDPSASIEYKIFIDGDNTKTADIISDTADWGGSATRTIDAELTSDSLVQIEINIPEYPLYYVWPESKVTTQQLKNKGYTVGGDISSCYKENSAGRIAIKSYNVTDYYYPSTYNVKAAIIDSDMPVKGTSFSAKITKEWEDTGETYQKPVYATRNVYKKVLFIKVKVGTETYIDHYKTAPLYEYYYYDDWDAAKSKPYVVKRNYYNKDVRWKSFSMENPTDILIVPITQIIDTSNSGSSYYLFDITETDQLASLYRITTRDPSTIKEEFYNVIYNEYINKWEHYPIFLCGETSMYVFTKNSSSRIALHEISSYGNDSSTIENIKSFFIDCLDDYEKSYKEFIGELERLSNGIAKNNGKLDKNEKWRRDLSFRISVIEAANILLRIDNASEATLKFIRDSIIRKDDQYIEVSENTYTNKNAIYSFLDKSIIMDATISGPNQSNFHILKEAETGLELSKITCERGSVYKNHKYCLSCGGIDFYAFNLKVCNISTTQKSTTWYSDTQYITNKKVDDGVMISDANDDSRTLTITVQPNFTGKCKHRGSAPTDVSHCTGRDTFSVTSTFS